MIRSYQIVREYNIKNTVTAHAEIRAQQRGIRSLIRNLLLDCDYEYEIYDGHGGIVRCFTRSICELWSKK